MAAEVAILPKLYDLILWFAPRIGDYPRKYKHTLGQRITDCQLDILEGIIEAAYSKNKSNVLRRSNLNLEKLRYLIRLSKDLQCLSLHRYEYAIKELDQIGRMVGGWQKHQRHNHG